MPVENAAKRTTSHLSRRTVRKRAGSSNGLPSLEVEGGWYQVTVSEE